MAHTCFLHSSTRNANPIIGQGSVENFSGPASDQALHTDKNYSPGGKDCLHRSDILCPGTRKNYTRPRALGRVQSRIIRFASLPKIKSKGGADVLWHFNSLTMQQIWCIREPLEASNAEHFFVEFVTPF